MYENIEIRNMRDFREALGIAEEISQENNLTTLKKLNELVRKIIEYAEEIGMDDETFVFLCKALEK